MVTPDTERIEGRMSLDDAARLADRLKDVRHWLAATRVCRVVARVVPHLGRHECPGSPCPTCLFLERLSEALGSEETE